KKRALLSEIEAQASATASTKREENGIAERLRRADRSSRWDLLVDHLRGEVGAVLGMSTNEVVPDVGFFELGMDSLMAVDLATRLAAGLGASVPPTLSFDYPNVEALAHFLLRDVLKLQSKVEGERTETNP